MKLLKYIILTAIFSNSVTAQNIKGTYLWKTAGIENDTIVSEISFLNDSIFIEKNYVGDKTTTLRNYETWPLKTIRGKIVKEKKYYKLYSQNGEKLELRHIFKIKKNSLWSFAYDSKKLKLKRCESMTYHTASL